MPKGDRSGASKSLHFKRWSNMITRCENPNTEGYKNYGGRGISVCEEWKDSLVFIAWCDETYIDGLTLDREDNDGNYSPDNCRWATRSKQTENSRMREDNSSGVRGVFFNKRYPSKPWWAFLTANKKNVLTSFHTTKEEAIVARQQAEREYL